MHFKERHDREQMMMVSYDTMVPMDNPVRLVDLMCRKFVEDNPWQGSWKGKENKGCRSYPPSVMLSLIIYGYFNRISSSRGLEKETYRNIEVLWLMEGLHPDHWTICEFRRNNEHSIRGLLNKFRCFLLGEGHASGEKLVFDGSKIKAYASREMLTQERILKKQEDLDKSISRYLSQIESNDSREDELGLALEEVKQLKKEIEKLEQKKEKLGEAGKAMESQGKRHIAPNDPDASLVKGRDGKFAGYNAQTGVDAKGHFIMHDEITTAPTDLGQLENCVIKAKKETGIDIKEVLADKGYADTTQILNLEDQGIQCYVPLPKTKQEQAGLSFEYDPSTDSYTCSQGKKLKLFAKNISHSRAIYNAYKCFHCHDCAIRCKCTNSKTGRIIKRNVRQTQIDRYKQKLQTNYGKNRIAERKGVVEHPFGTIKWLMGKFNFLLTGKEKTQIELDLYVTAYNLKRLINCAPIKELSGQMIKYNWAIA